MFEGSIREVDNTLADRSSCSDDLATNDEMENIHYLRLKIIVGDFWGESFRLRVSPEGLLKFRCQRGAH